MTAPQSTAPRSGGIPVSLAGTSPLAAALRTTVARAAELADECRSLTRCYPPFVTLPGGALDRRDIPVFVFHTIEPAEFARQLRFLVDGGYRTLGIEEFAGLMRGTLRPRARSVLLTIDDARSSAWRYGLPLLRKFGCRAVLFAIPGYTHPADTVRPALDESRSLAPQRARLDALDPGDDTLCTWPELDAMQASGCIEVQSHSYRHARVIAEPRVLGLLEDDPRLARFDGPASPWLARSREPWRVDPRGLRGAPVFPTRALCAGLPHFDAPLDALAEFRQGVERDGEGGPSAALDQTDRRRLARSLAILRLEPVDGAAAFARVVDDLALARDALVARYGAMAGRAFCVPFSEGSRRTLEAARRVGVRHVFWGRDPARRINRAPGDTSRIVRLKHDFIERLPGTARRSLAAIYGAKVRRRASGAAPY